MEEEHWVEQHYLVTIHYHHEADTWMFLSWPAQVHFLKLRLWRKSCYINESMGGPIGGGGREARGAPSDRGFWELSARTISTPTRHGAPDAGCPPPRPNFLRPPLESFDLDLDSGVSHGLGSTQTHEYSFTALELRCKKGNLNHFFLLKNL